MSSSPRRRSVFASRLVDTSPEATAPRVLDDLRIQATTCLVLDRCVIDHSAGWRTSRIPGNGM